MPGGWKSGEEHNNLGTIKEHLVEKSNIVTKIQIDGLAIWLVIGFGALIRLVTLGRQSLWLDEGVSFWTANRPWNELIELLSRGFRPLYFVLLHPMVLLGGDEWLLRLPSAVVGIASIVLLYALGKELFDEKTGLLAAILLAFSPVHVWYSQEARMYALVGFLVVASAYFAARAFRTNQLLDWVLCGIFEGLALWTESAAVWFVLAINLTALLIVRDLVRNHSLWKWVISQVVAVLIYLPAISKLFQAVQSSNTLWIPPATIVVLLRTISDLAGGFQRTRIEGVLALLLLGVGLLAGAWNMVREARSSRSVYIFLIVWFLGVVGTSFVISQPYYRPPIFTALFGQRASVFLTRNLITALFPLLLLLARSLRLSRVRNLRTAILVGFILLNLAGYLGNSLPFRKENYRAAAEIVAQRSTPDDLVLVSPGYIEQPLAYYYLETEPAGLPLEMVRDGVVGDHSQIYETPIPLLEGVSRVWLVTNQNIFQPPDDDLLYKLENEMHLTQTWAVEGVTVRLFEPGTTVGRNQP